MKGTLARDSGGCLPSGTCADVCRKRAEHRSVRVWEPFEVLGEYCGVVKVPNDEEARQCDSDYAVAVYKVTLIHFDNPYLSPTHLKRCLHRNRALSAVPVCNMDAIH